MTHAAVEAEVRYLNDEWKAREEIPRIGDRDSRRANTTKRRVQITDARGLVGDDALDLDRNGFVLLKHATAVRSFHDDATIREVYYPEIEALTKTVTGADVVEFVEHVVRTEDRGDFNKAYARFLHCDYNLAKGAEEARAMFERRGVKLDARKNWAFAFYNTWQPIDRPAARNPLAVIAGDSMAADDFVDYYYTGFGTDGIGSMPVFNGSQRLYYFPNMQTDELLMFKQLDTRPGRAIACPHTSFDDPTTPGDAPGRRSIEVRILCAFAV